MIRTNNQLTALLLLSFLTPFLSAEEARWHTDFEAAQKKALEEKKDLLIHFTGSDWCGWCIKLEKEIFSNDSFKKQIANDYVLVKIDFPRREKLAPELIKQNANLKAKYNVMGHPTVTLCDSKGRPYAQTGYKRGGPNEYLKYLAKLRSKKTSRDAGIAVAVGLEGKEKARALEQALSALPRTALSFYEREIDMIREADPDDMSGFHNRYLVQRTGTELARIVYPLISKEKYEVIVTKINDYIREKKLKGEPLQTALIFMLRCHYLAKEYDKALKCADQIIAINNLNGPGRYAAMLRKRITRNFKKQ